MDALGWIVAVLVLLLLGKNINLSASLPLDNSNAVPTVNDNLPVMSSQNTNDTPANQAAPWRSACSPTGQPTTIYQSALGNMPLSQALPMTPSKVIVAQPRVTFTQ
jgi:hypothetical protein